mgnify:CR=1 FL=1
MSLGSLEHSYDINRSLKEIFRVLKKKGNLIIRWRADKIKGSPLEYYNHNHFRYFTKKNWEGILNKHGFKIIKDCSMIEIKQGPFIRTVDKIRFEKVDEKKIKFK